ncbi:MAG: hypothetical protein ACI90V_013164, partial [Bacillariaceae sp.]
LESRVGEDFGQTTMINYFHLPKSSLGALKVR